MGKMQGQGGAANCRTTPVAALSLGVVYRLSP